jgi:hypothetical protein
MFEAVVFIVISGVEYRTLIPEIFLKLEVFEAIPNDDKLTLFGTVLTSLV